MKYFVAIIIALLIAAPVQAQMTTTDAADDSVVAQTFNDMNKGFKSLRGRIAKLEKNPQGAEIFQAIEAAALQAADREALTTVGGDSTNVLFVLYLQNRATPPLKKAAVQKYMGQLGAGDPRIDRLVSDLSELRNRLARLATKDELKEVTNKTEEDLKKVAHAAGIAADGQGKKEDRRQAVQWLANR